VNGAFVGGDCTPGDKKPRAFAGGDTLRSDGGKGRWGKNRSGWVRGHREKKTSGMVLGTRAGLGGLHRGKEGGGGGGGG